MRVTRTPTKVKDEVRSDALVYSQTVFKFVKADSPTALIALKGNAQSFAKPAIINPDWNMENMVRYAARTRGWHVTGHETCGVV